jgi:integrase
MKVRKRHRNGDPAAPGAAPEPVVAVRMQATLAEFAQEWLRGRERTRKTDTQRLHDHAFPLLGGRRLRDIRSEDLAEVVRHTLAKKGMKVESAKKAFEVLSELIGAALERKLLPSDPRALPADIWPVEEPTERPRFSPREVSALTGDERLDPELRLMNLLSFGTGLPSRTLTTLRFADWPIALEPPLGPEIAAAVARWKAHGFEAVYGRPPIHADWLVPRRSNPSEPYTEGSLYKAFRRACVTLGIKTRSPHAVRNTFEALAGAAGPATEAVELKGDDGVREA